MEKNTIIAQIVLKKDKKRKLMELQDEYEFCTSGIIFHIAHCVACKLLKGKKIFDKRNPKNTISRYALDLYRPFSFNTANPEKFNISYILNFTGDSLKEKLKQVGILEPNLFFAAIARAIIKYPYDASRVKILGVYTKKGLNLLRTKMYRNTKIYSTINLPIEVHDVFKEIAKKNNSSMNSMIVEVVKSICNIDFNNNTFTENHEVFRKVILEPARVVERNKHCQYGRTKLCISDICLSVQFKAVIEKYSIPSISDFVKRIVYFILSVHNGDIKLNTVAITDNDDYNETRMVRDAYRKELTYGAH